MTTQPKPERYRLWLNPDRTLLVRQWEEDGSVEVAEREHSGATWGPPTALPELPDWIANLTEEV